MLLHDLKWEICYGTMSNPTISQAANMFNQQGQTVHGGQLNLAGDIHLHGVSQEAWPSIRPLRTDTIPDARRSQLQSEFYEGGYTRFEHILAGLAEIAQAFEKRNIVIIHAASGQGKTTLAYRYLVEHYPDGRRYAIERIPDLHHALDIAKALAERVAAEPEIIAVYMDVHPQDTAWTELARQLAGHAYLHLLITVREEDFRRANITGAGFAFEPVDLLFSKEEARLIYQRRSSSLLQSNFLSFEEAWIAFGAGGPLLEFVYLLTHTTTLRDRLAAQVFALRQEARQEKNRDKLQVLELVAVASVYEARLQTAKLIHTLDLFDPAHIFQLLEQEYLIRRNEEEQTIGGLHAVRSQILVELLTSPDVNPWLALAQRVLPLLCEEELEMFLLHAMVEHPADFSALLQTMTTFQPDTWRGAAGLLRCLLWAGVRAYVDANQDVIEEA
ncbi:MAG TPA: hypothetical protein PKE45_18795, partial [Caldilineaceae bacterium]|nr:hypothetical protein [Caldilineaceae bacterium]